MSVLGKKKTIESYKSHTNAAHTSKKTKEK